MFSKVDSTLTKICSTMSEDRLEALVLMQAHRKRVIMTLTSLLHMRVFIFINVKNFHGSLTTDVRAQNDTTKTANITDTIFDRTLV